MIKDLLVLITFQVKNVRYQNKTCLIWTSTNKPENNVE